MPEEQCTFCEIYQNKIGIFFENEFFFSRFDKFPVSPGHAELIPKRHIPSILELKTEEFLDLKQAIRQTMEAIEDADLKKIYSEFFSNPLNRKSAEFCRKILSLPYLGKTPDAYNIGINEGAAAGQTIPHLHIHIIPRYFGDVQNPEGGVRHIIPEMGRYK